MDAKKAQGRFLLTFFFFTVFGFFGYFFMFFLFFLGTILLFVWFYIYL